MEPRQHAQWVPHYGSEFPFTVVSYNLADSSCCLSPGEKDKKQGRLCNHIIESNADIVCLQDVGDWCYWKTIFLAKKFSGYWKRRPGTQSGCCIFIKTSRFKARGREFIDNEVIKCCDCEHFIAQIVVLEDICSNCTKQIVIVCNVQTDSDALNGAMILEQLDVVFRQINKQAGIFNYPEENHIQLQPRILICGNFNFIPTSSISDFVRSGRLELAEKVDPTLLTGVKNLVNRKEVLSSGASREMFNGKRNMNADKHRTSRNRVEVVSPLRGEDITFHPANTNATKTVPSAQQSSTTSSFISNNAITVPNKTHSQHSHQLKPSYKHCLERLRPIYNCDFLNQLPTNVQRSPRKRDSQVVPLLDNIWYSVGTLSVPEILWSQFHLEEYFHPKSAFLICRLMYLGTPLTTGPQLSLSSSTHPSNQQLNKPLSPEEQKWQDDFRELFRSLLMEAFTADRPTDVKTLDRERAIKQVVQLKDQLELELQHSSDVLDLNLGRPLTLSINRFGSTIFGLDSRNSDVDLVIEVQIGGERVLFPKNDFQFPPDFQHPVNGSNELTAPLSKLRVIILKRLAEILEANEDKIQVIQKRFGAFVPLVKASVDYGNEPVTLDLSVLTEDKTLLAANCITSVLKWHSAVSPFLFAVKQWAQIMDISNAYTGTINSYGWINMAIWSLRYLYRTPRDPSSPNERVIPQDKTSDALFEEFIWSLSESCFRDYAVAMKVSDGSIVPNRLLEPSQYPTLTGHRLWVLLDPVDDKCNIIRTLQVQGVKNIENAIKRTQVILKESPAFLYQNKGKLPTSLGELFCQFKT